MTTTAATVGEALEQAGISLNPADEVDPPLSSALPLGESAGSTTVTVARVTETLEMIPESIPYGRRIVRSAEMSPDDAPRILQTGRPGLQEVSVRIVFRNGLEAERWPTAVQVIEPAVDEIIMIGVGRDQETMTLPGRLAYLSNGRAIVLEGSTDLPRQLNIEETVDGRVFALSPDGQYLLYTISRGDEAEAAFSNELWVIPTAPEAVGRPLQIENVLWADWDPASIDPPRIAYTTARSVSLPPGWEAINDLWLMTLPNEGELPSPVRLVETYPATLGWWGGNYAWSPDGRRMAYAFADEIGILDMAGIGSGDSAQPAPAEPARASLHNFTAYETRGDWAWIPNLGWSADGRYLTYTAYDTESGQFGLWLADTAAGGAGAVPLVEKSGLWAAAAWSPAAGLPGSRIAYLRAIDPDDSEESSYSLWLADGDGSNETRLFPPEGEVGSFDRTSHSLSWGPSPDMLAFIFDDELHILNLVTNDLFRAGADDTVNSHPTWAPYGIAARP